MRKSKQKLAFEQLESEMDIIAIEELMTHFGGTGSAQDIIDYMNATGKKSWSSSSTDDILGFSASGFSSGGFYGAGGGFWGSSSSSGYSSSGGFDGGSGNVSIQIDAGGAYLIDGNTYYSSSGVPYRKVSFDQGNSWTNEAMPIAPIIPANTGIIETASNPWATSQGLYLSNSDVSRFLDDMGTSAGATGLSMIAASYIPMLNNASNLMSGLSAIDAMRWQTIRQAFQNSPNQNGMVIMTNTSSQPYSPFPIVTYTVQDIYGNRIATFGSH